MDRVTAAGGAGALRFFVSGHASLEELALIGRIGGTLGVPEDGVAISWRRREKPQPPNVKFGFRPTTLRTCLERRTRLPCEADGNR